MKKLFTLSVALLGAGSVLAQKHPMSLSRFIDPALRSHHERMERLINRIQTVPDAARTTAVKQRVIAESIYDFGGGTPALSDSIGYRYTGINGSKYNFNTFEYNYYYDPIYGAPIGYGADAYKPEVVADSAMFYNDAGSLTGKVKIAYNSDMTIANYLSESYSGGTMDYADRYINTYASGKLKQSLYIVYNGSSWDTSNRKVFNYNGAGKLQSDTVYAYNAGVWELEQRDSLVYFGAGELGSVLTDAWDPGTSSWTVQQRYDMTYYTGGKLKDFILSIAPGGTLIPIIKDSFAYAPGADFYLNEYVSQNGGAGLEPIARILKHLNTQNLPDTMLVETYDGSSWQAEEKGVFTYNSFNNPVQLNAFDNTSAPTVRFNYYYEQYNDPTSVPPVAGGQQIKVYPNPAVSDLRIEWKNADRNALTGVSLINLTGQKVYTEQLRWTSDVHRINTAGLAPGMYLLTVTDAQGRSLHTQRVVKQ